MSIDLGDYNTVPERIAEFREKYPEGCFQPVDPANPYRVETIGEKTFIVYAAAAYRNPDDVKPGIGLAWEPFPGKTQFTRDSELQNAETSAWGRAIVAVLAADTRKGVASQEEVRNRQADRDQWEEAKPANPEQSTAFQALLERIRQAADLGEISKIGVDVKAAKNRGDITAYHYERLDRAAGARIAALNGAPS